MTTIVSITLGVSDANALWICVFFLMPFTGLYVALGGLWGVLWTDVFQFVLKMTIVIAVAYYAVSAVGGMVIPRPSGLRRRTWLMDSYTYFNRAFVPEREATVSVRSRALKMRWAI